MSLRSPLLVFAGILLAGALPALASGPAHNPGSGGPPGNPASRIVGLWYTDVFVSPAGCTPGAPTPPLTGHNTLVFNEGGTVVENPQVTPAGVPGAPQLRTFGLGRWSYHPGTRRYELLLRFDWYASGDGGYTGYQVIERTMQMSNDRLVLSGPVKSTRYAVDGTVLARACGEAVSTRQ